MKKKCSQWKNLAWFWKEVDWFRFYTQPFLDLSTFCLKYTLFIHVVAVHNYQDYRIPLLCVIYAWMHQYIVGGYSLRLNYCFITFFQLAVSKLRGGIWSW